ncbi:MAG: pyruvate kinase [bacterium]|nr:pyruvate kinase [bacterium]
MQKLTKIIATIGPACDSEEKIEELILKGVNVFRFNFKHSSVEWHSERIKRVNAVAHKLGIPVGTLIDLAGPEIRIRMKDDAIDIEKDEELLLSERTLKGAKAKGFSITRPSIIQYLTDGQHAVADDGAFSFTVVKKGSAVYLKSHTKGTLATNKSLNIPGADFPLPTLIDRDLDGLKLAAANEIDFIALSFVRSASDIRDVRKEAKKHKINALIISKVEAQRALDNIDKIIDASDGIMVARGDLGVEIAIEQVPFYQKMIIRKCIIAGKFAITATQMLQSMISSPLPTRAEVSDVANAIYDHTDAIMLSGETATGKFPGKSVDMMRRTALFYEPKHHADIRTYISYSVKDTTAMVCDTAYNLYRRYISANQPIAGFVVFSQSGKTARILSQYRPQVPIYTFTPKINQREALTATYGIIPLPFDYHQKSDVGLQELTQATKLLSDQHYIQKGEKLIVLHGDQWGHGSGATSIRIL